MIFQTVFQVFLYIVHKNYKMNQVLDFVFVSLSASLVMWRDLPYNRREIMKAMEGSPNENHGD